MRTRGLIHPTYRGFQVEQPHPEFPDPTAPIESIAPGVIVGLGNDIMCDDGVGIAVIRRLPLCVTTNPLVDCIELPWAGLSLLDVLRNRQWAIIVDCLITGRWTPGTVKKLSENDIGGSVRLLSYHDISYPAALRLGRELGWMLPDDVTIIAIEGQDVYDFGEQLSPRVDEAADCVTYMITDLVHEKTA